MATQPAANNPHDICTWRPASGCADCQINGQLECRFTWRELAYFFVLFMPVAVPAVIGMIQGGYGWWLLGWVGFMMFFFFVWEARILCSHCPYWAEGSGTLHCLANYGVFKIWPFHPEPMSRSEQAQFIVGASIIVGYPLVFLILGGQWVLLVVAVVNTVAVGWSLLKARCTRCVNFSCPANRVPKPVVDAYLKRNPVMRQAWEAHGWQIED